MLLLLLLVNSSKIAVQYFLTQELLQHKIRVCPPPPLSLYIYISVSTKFRHYSFLTLSAVSRSLLISSSASVAFFASKAASSSATRAFSASNSAISSDLICAQTKITNEYILMVLFVLLLKRVHFLANKT